MAEAPGLAATHDHAHGRAEQALRLIQGPWKQLILRELRGGPPAWGDRAGSAAELPP